jgi:hypothetical protein
VKSFDNIEFKKSPFGDYRCGYGSNGVVFKITGGNGNWSAQNHPKVPANAGKPIVILSAATLGEMSKKLAELKSAA